MTNEQIRDKLNRFHPTFQRLQTGDVLAYAPVVFEINVNRDARSGESPVEFDVPFGCKVIGGWVICTDADSGGTVKIDDGSDDIIEATACAVDKDVEFADAIDHSKTDLDAGDTIRAVTNQTGTRGKVYVLALKQ